MFNLLQRIKNKKKGFTLIELIVVLAILGILIAILVPSMMNIVSNAKTSVRKANAHTLYSVAQSTYVSLSLIDNTTPAAGTYNSTDATNDYIKAIENNLGSGFSDAYSVTVDANGVTQVTLNPGTSNELVYTPSTGTADSSVISATSAAV